VTDIENFNPKAAIDIPWRALTSDESRILAKEDYQRANAALGAVFCSKNDFEISSILRHFDRAMDPKPDTPANDATMNKMTLLKPDKKYEGFSKTVMEQVAKGTLDVELLQLKMERFLISNDAPASFGIANSLSDSPIATSVRSAFASSSTSFTGSARERTSGPLAPSSFNPSLSQPTMSSAGLFSALLADAGSNSPAGVSSAKQLPVRTESALPTQNTQSPLAAKPPNGHPASRRSPRSPKAPTPDLTGSRPPSRSSRASSRLAQQSHSRQSESAKTKPSISSRVMFAV